VDWPVGATPHIGERNISAILYLPYPSGTVVGRGCVVNPSAREALSLSGHPLKGDQLVRLVYLDEAGIGNPKQEPIVVVGGIVVNADREWKALERYLIDMADEFAPAKHRHEFIFHAKDVFHGGGFFPRSRWNKEDRWKILEHLCDIPKKFDIPIVWGKVIRSEFANRYPDEPLRMQAVKCQTIAFNACSIGIEFYMKRYAGENEVASIVMENNDQARSMIKEFHSFARNPLNAPWLKEKGFGKFAFERIIDTVHFAEKTDSSLLQVADAVSFCMKRYLMNTPESSRFYDALRPMLAIVPNRDPTSAGGVEL
jgi:hypothetical protein